ncbi:SRPBCC family protein [Streptomyces sp. bgisy159]|uniref:SRPBCC family protein n=1 Tax=Streptomyces sp. bgisy159 TaxID=3413795 RepID=UPI003F4A2F45
MEQQVFVAVPPDRLRSALADPARVARAVPGLQQDAGADGTVAGRLKLRAGGHSITYRGELRVGAADDGTRTLRADGTEARGTGSVHLALTLRVTPADGGSTLHLAGTATADGRLTELPADTVESTATRLFHRFAENLTEVAAEAGETGADRRPEEERPATAEPRPGGETGPGPETPAQADADEAQAESDEAQAEADEPQADGSVFEAEVPPPSLGPSEEEDGFDPLEEPPAEAAHARRTMIGRSAEEVDHAPPRGRYAPVPAPQTVAPHSTLRWAAPAAALVVASAIVVGRALRRRRP